MDFLGQLLGAHREYARAQLVVSKICLEQQLYRNLMCNMCGMNSGSCYCGPCGGSAVASGCCVDSCNVTHETITDKQAKETILLYLSSNDIKSRNDLETVFEEGKKLSGDQNDWVITTAGGGAATTPTALYAEITQGAKRFAVFLIDKKGATFVTG
jgi:hypothetical protein